MQNCHNDSLRIKSKVWIEIQGKPLFGQGRMELLRLIDTHGSINQAARELDMSYRKAWSYVKFMEDRVGIKLVERHTGGQNGGGASLTGEAREFIAKFEGLSQGIEAEVNEKFRKIFTLQQVGGSNLTPQGRDSAPGAARDREQ